MKKCLLIFVMIVFLNSAKAVELDHIGKFKDKTTTVLLTNIWMDSIHGFFANYETTENNLHWGHDHSYTIEDEIVTIKCWYNISNCQPMKKDGEISFKIVDGGKGLERENAYLIKVSDDANVPGMVGF